MKDFKKILTRRKKIIGKLIMQIRRSSPEVITQKKVSEAVGSTQSAFMQKIEKGSRHLDVSELWEICRTLNVSFVSVAEKIDEAIKESEHPEEIDKEK